MSLSCSLKNVMIEKYIDNEFVYRLSYLECVGLCKA